ncbi:MAG: CHRD domain-containing protein [Acidobacteria bacterium]|nr:CHRD domain-containing protein [Acidobacteriota bacterium]
MRRGFVMLLAGGLFLIGSAQAQAQVIQLTAALNGAEEAPNKVTTGSHGQATVTYNPATRDVTWNIQVFNMPSGTQQAHFHVGGVGVAGPIVVNITVPPQISNDYTLSGTANASALIPRTDQGIGSWDDFIQSLLGGQTYLNVHSNNNPGGEIRGQVLRVP